MRKIIKYVPMEMMVPNVYNIEIELNGEESSLYYVEGYEPGVMTQQVVDDTLRLAKNLLPQAEFTADIENGFIKMKLIAPEAVIINFMIEEFQGIQPPVALPPTITDSPFRGLL